MGPIYKRKPETEGPIQKALQPAKNYFQKQDLKCIKCSPRWIIVAFKGHANNMHLAQKASFYCCENY